MLLPSYSESDICHLLNAEIERKAHLAIHTKQGTMNFNSSLCLEGITAVCLELSHLISFKCPASEYLAHG